jgi:rhamnose transport system permease protein
VKNLDRRSLALFGVLVVLVLAIAQLDPRFATVRAQSLLLPHLWELALVALPMTFVIVMGAIDLSVGSTIALTSIAFAMMFEAKLPLPICIGGTIVLGGVLGWINGFLVTRGKIHSLLVTLGTMAAYRGLAEGISAAKPFSGFPEGFRQISEFKLIGLTAPGWIFIVLSCAAGFVLSRHGYGRWVRLIGQNEKVARFAGIPVDRVQVAVFTATGLICAVVGLMLTARNNTAKADMGTGMELEAITAVVLGGVSILGGVGRISGVVLAVFILHFTREFVTWHWRKSEWNLIVIGVLLLLAVVVSLRLDSKRLRRAS